MRFCSSFALLACQLATSTALVGAVEEEKGWSSCLSTVQQQFVQAALFSQAMSLYSVSQSQWMTVVESYRKELNSLRARLEKRAKSLSPNPLHPLDQEQASALLYQELLELFSAALNRSQFFNQGSIVAMFDYIIRQQPEGVQRCFPSAKRSPEWQETPESKRSPDRRPLAPVSLPGSGQEDEEFPTDQDEEVFDDTETDNRLVR